MRSLHRLHRAGATRPALLAGSLAVIAIIGIAAFFILRSRAPSADDDPNVLPPPSESVVELPMRWSEHADAAAPVTVTLGPKGPVLGKEELTLDLGLTIEGAPDLTWSTSDENGQLVLRGETQVNGATIALQWVLKMHDPQISLLIDLQEAPLTALDQPITASMTLPESTFQAIRHTMDPSSISSRTILDSWTPGWIKANLTQAGATLTLSEWTVAAVIIDPDATQQQVTLSIWDPASSPDFKDCEERKTLSMRQHLTLTLGERLSIVPSRYAQGYRAAVAPVFIDPVSHYARTYKDGRATSAQDWAARGRTLLYGHSSEQDPRFGNGGLLGLGHSADLAIETPWKAAKEVSEFASSLSDTRAHLLSRRPSKEKPEPGQGLLLDAPHCEPFLSHNSPYLTLGGARSMDQLNILAHPPTLQVGDDIIQRQLPNVSHAFAPHVEVPQLSGRRQALADAVFSPQALEQLTKERGLYLFATPLIATRNPLTPGATQALLEPERGGHWTLSEPISRALANVELINEQHELLVSSPTSLMTHWQRARQVHIMEMPDGSFAIINPLSEPIAGFTMLASGNLTPVLPEDAELSGREVVTTRSGASQTWFWWTLQPGTTRLDLGPSNQQSALSPVLWQLQGAK